MEEHGFSDHNEMIAFTHVEDYIECIAGAKTSHLHIPPVVLARYDRSPIMSFVTQINNGIGLTDRQSQLALRFITNYRRQLLNNGVDVTGILASPRYRLPLRVIDRSTTAVLTDSGVSLKFPFNGKYVDTIRKFAETSDGSVNFDHDKKTWDFALTESCVNFAVAFSESANFDIQPELAAIAADICKVEEQPFAIELQKANDQIVITNAPPTLLEYIESNGGLTRGNMLWLVDNSARLGYTVSAELLSDVPFPLFAAQYAIKLHTVRRNLERLVEYAKTYNRFPIVSCQPTDPVVEDSLNALFDSSEIVNIVRGVPSRPINENTKVIHIHGTTYKSIPDNIPLLLCYTSMMYGGFKSLLLQNASKVCYYCDYHLAKNLEKKQHGL